MPLQRCRSGELVHLGGKSLAFKSEEQYLLLSYAQTLNIFLPFFFPSIFFFFVCVPSTSPSIYTLSSGLFKIAKEAEITPSFYLRFQKNANQETQP